MSRPTLALAMIVRNEGKHLRKCLDSVKEFVDEMIIVDTGSDDNTMEIARQYTNKVYHYKWHNDFAAARNYALEQVSSEWVLSLDADEWLEAAPGELEALITNERRQVYFLPLFSFGDSFGGKFDQFMVLRLFKQSYRFKGSIHEQIIVPDPSRGGYAMRPVIRHDPVSLKERLAKRGRNISLLKLAIAQEPENPFLYYYIGADWLGFGRFDYAIAALQQALKGLPEEQVTFRTPAIRFLTTCYSMTGKIAEGIRLCRTECERYPAYSDLWFSGGTLFEAMGDYGEAMRWYHKALEAGKPPPGFYHTDGTESYLTLYHLGGCLEALGRYREARNCFDQAWQANKEFYFALIKRLILDLTHTNPEQVFSQLVKEGLPVKPETARILADFFWDMGLSDLACKCLADAMPFDEDTLRALVKYELFSGRINPALDKIRDLTGKPGALTEEMLTLQCMALLLKQEYRSVRKLAYVLWRQPERRNTAWAMLNLCAMMAQEKPCGRAETWRAKAVAQCLTDMLENCWRSRLQTDGERRAFARLSGNIIAVLKRWPEGIAALAQSLREHEQAVSRSLANNLTVSGAYEHETRTDNQLMPDYEE